MTERRVLFDWEYAGCHCPSCGSLRVWQERGEGDFYTGPALLCLACGSDFAIPYCGPTTKMHDPVLEALRAVEKQKEEVTP